MPCQHLTVILGLSFSKFDWYVAKLNAVSLTSQQRARDTILRGKCIEVALSSLTIDIVVAIDA